MTDDGIVIPITQQRCAFVALIGAPNAGKSTLTNQLVGQKVSIVTPKVQTTRNRIRGICMADDITQLVLIDTPGIFSGKNRLDKAMVKAAWDGVSEADQIVLLVDAGKGLCDNTRRIMEELARRELKAVLVLNKVDRVPKEKLLGLAMETNASGLFSDTFMVSALSGDGVADLQAFLAGKAPMGPWMYPSDQLSDINDRLMAAEITREKLFLNLQQELPYALSVETEMWEDRKDGSLRMEQTIYVERESQKGIILGKQGQRLKQIGSSARRELEDMLDCRVHLFLFVKVRDNWKQNPEVYRMLGLDYE